MARRIRKPAVSPARRAGKIVYRTAVVLSAIIIAAYCAFLYLSRPPEYKAAAAPIPASLTGGGAGRDTPGSGGQEPGVTRKEYTYTFLLLATDQGSGNTDTMIAATYDTVNQTVGLVSIPRDTMIDGVRASDGYQFHKLNSMYSMNGIDALKEEVSKILGYPIDYYVKVSVNGFVRLVDAVGGVDFYVPVRMCYDDPTQDLHIHFDEGMNWLSGADALKVARCRQNSDGPGVYPHNLYPVYPDYDIGRTKTQRELLSTVLKKALANPQKFPEYFDILFENVQTDLDLNALTYFSTKALEFDFSTGLTTSALPGDGSITYKGWTACYQLYPDQVLEIVNSQNLNPYTTSITADMLDIAQK